MAIALLPGSPSGSPAPLADGLPLAITVLRAWAAGVAVRETAPAAIQRAAATLLAQNRMLGLVGDRLLQAGADYEVASKITAFRRLTAEMNGANLLLMRGLSVLLADIGVPVVVYKGVALQNDLYGTPFARPSSDVDLLTSPGAYDRVAEALRAAGYRLDPHTDTVWWRRFLAEQQFRRGQDAQSIDLHYRVQQPGCPMPRRPERLLAHARPQTFIGGEILTFAPNHAILVAAMSLAKALHHREPAGRYLGDLLRMLERVGPDGWSGLHNEACELGLARTLDLAVRCVAAVFGAREGPEIRPILPDVPDEALQLMLLAPAQAPVLIRRRRLLRAICDRRADVLPTWILMAASEGARLVSPAPSTRDAAR